MPRNHERVAIVNRLRENARKCKVDLVREDAGREQVTAMLNRVRRSSWLRRELRAADLSDLKAKRKPATKDALKARVHSICQTTKVKSSAKNIMSGRRRVCQIVKKKNGGASGK